ncbi:GNAT family N-acetyltransferase [Paenibacillus sp. MZ04-78.2]|uniref:GNAT family N-acetyltransferase n=1 Tax=Paenibacillus sp. MZ04-78.2 TaxID=2962034 RepID=UPI0020B654EB|nr:GNAT family N-acetyltransferase [Paenibacillus sp. MZ04-78.2]MCP3774025.1 GNAT family N-acetyltransferase [Paenibacillus sp. MZ04-78.2]
MTVAPITIEPMQAQYNRQVGQLLVHGFGGKFKNLTKMNDGDLGLFFEQLFDNSPTDPSSQRMVALQEGEVIGTISIKWSSESGTEHKPKKKFPSMKSFKGFRKWILFKMLIGLYFFEDHRLEAGECYISDVVVHPDHRSKGVGKLLMQWAQDFVQTEPELDRLSLYVSGKNPRAKHLYERLSFHTHLESNSLIWQLLFKEKKWAFMVMKFSKEKC